MLRIAGVFMVLLLSVFGYALGQSKSSVRVDTAAPLVEVTAKLKDSLQNESAHDNHVDNREGNKSIERPSSEAVGEPTFLWLTSNQWTALGTVIIAIFTVVLAWGSGRQWKAIKEANEVARDAADATKKSVDSYVGRERGRLILKKLKRMSSKGGNGFEYQFVNAGPTGIVVHGFGHDVVREVVAEDGAITIDPIDDISLSAITYYVGPGKSFGVVNNDGDPIAADRGLGIIPDEIADHDRLPHNNIVAVFDIAYETSFGSYHKREVASFADFGHVGFLDGTLSYDLPQAEWIERQRKEEKK